MPGRNQQLPPLSVRTNLSQLDPIGFRLRLVAFLNGALAAGTGVRIVLKSHLPEGVRPEQLLPIIPLHGRFLHDSARNSMKRSREQGSTGAPERKEADA